MRHQFLWDLKDPAATLADILRTSDAGLGDVVIAHVDLESQHVTGTHVMPPDTPASRPADDPDLDLSDRLRRIAEELAPEREWTGDRRGPITGFLFTVVCRDGRVVDTAVEWRWMNAWWFSNQNTTAFTGDVYVVTPHGWTGILDTRAGLTPTLRQLRAC
ncbi:MAG: hypothetical protein V9G19_22040 [Tetrasphaera sp.]